MVETKAWSKPDKVWELYFDGQQIHIPTRAPDSAPIIQCRAETASIKSLLRDSTSKSFAVRGVVVFLDWYVERKPAARGSDVWVLNPKERCVYGVCIERTDGWVRDLELGMGVASLKRIDRTC